MITFTTDDAGNSDGAPDPTLDELRELFAGQPAGAPREAPSPARCIGAVLEPLTEEARRAARRDAITIDRFPFKVGRECRSSIARVAAAVERRLRLTEPNNDIYLVDEGDPLLVSREHFLIDVGEGGAFITDRGSSCGLLVGDRAVGGHRQGGRAALSDGDTITIGPASSALRFRFVVAATTPARQGDGGDRFERFR